MGVRDRRYTAPSSITRGLGRLEVPFGACSVARLSERRILTRQGGQGWLWAPGTVSEGDGEAGGGCLQNGLWLG